MADMRALKARIEAKRQEDIGRTKLIPFQLPDDKAEWNVFSLTARADWLMTQAGVSESVRSEFKMQATTGGNFDTVLETLDEWFTVLVRSHDYTELDESLLAYYYRLKDANDAEDEAILVAAGVAEEEDPEAAKLLLDALDVRAAEKARQDEIAARTVELVRNELGLSDDEDVIVRIVRRKG